MTVLGTFILAFLLSITNERMCSAQELTSENVNLSFGRKLEKRDTEGQALDTGLMFDGCGYVILSKERFKPNKYSRVKLSFRTYAENGLLFLIGNEIQDFLSLELRDGQVLYQYDLGRGRAQMQSQQKLNDGKWHTIIGSRLQQDGILKIDQVTASTGRAPGNSKELEMDRNIYIGGFKGTHNYTSVTQQSFAGCIKDIQLQSTIRDIHNYTAAENIWPGCPEIPTVNSRCRPTVGYDDSLSGQFVQRSHLTPQKINRRSID